MPSLDVAKDAEHLQCPDDEPSRVELVPFHAHSRGPRIRVMVVVKALAEREDTEEEHVSAFSRCAVDAVAHVADLVRDVADEPVTENAASDTQSARDGRNARPEDQPDDECQ